ncbi:BatA domain-containing protein [Arenimonas sp.]|uniref:BatA domain-containing protein n=1 Tax=Arenimonas sp. TaxID=1872635 RepID=UPI0035B32342
MSLAFPLGLLALLGLALPLLVHLARREEQVPTMFAALRWLQARRKPQRRFRLEEFLLLALRLALVTGLALLLAAPFLRGSTGAPAWVLVHPALDPAQVQRDADTPAHWLAPGFPPVDSPAPAAPVPVASLLRQADAELAPSTALAVWLPERVDGFDGERPRLSRAVDWRVLPAADRTTAVEAHATPFALAIRHAPDRADQARWLRAAQKAWQVAAHAEAPAGDAAITGTPLPEGTQAVAWLAEGDLPENLLAWIEAGGTALLAHDATWPAGAAGNADDTDWLREARLGAGRVLQWRQPLVAEALPALLEPAFPTRLRARLQPPPPAPTLADAAALAPRPGAGGFEPAPRPLEPWLLAALGLLFALERWFAASPRRGVAA